MSISSPDVLRTSNLHAYYGESHILQGVDFFVRRGELVTLLGRNGAGRTTTLKAIIGLVGQRTGSVAINGRETISMPTFKIARLGIGYCPEERGIFANLSTAENFSLPPIIAQGAMPTDEIYEMFPNLKERQASSGAKLSGGEQQMLALARILRTGAQILLLDEITEGLAPVIIKSLENAVRRLKDRGYTIILVEQNFGFTEDIADRHYVIDRGRVVLTVERAELEGNMPQLRRMLGL